jgi:hypothetical protein
VLFFSHGDVFERRGDILINRTFALRAQLRALYELVS